MRPVMRDLGFLVLQGQSNSASYVSTIKSLMIDTHHKQASLQSALFVVVTDLWSLMITVLFNPT